MSIVSYEASQTGVGTDVYIHIRHFTPRVNGWKTNARVLLWLTDGTEISLIATNKIENRFLDFHLVCGPILLPSPIAYVQVTKCNSWWWWFFQTPDIYVRDVYLKTTESPSPDDNAVLAFFPFNGHVRERSIVVKNHFVHSPNVTVETIRSNVLNAGRVVDDVLVPSLQWAQFSTFDGWLQRLRTIIDAGGLRALIRSNRATTLQNFFLLFKLNADRYLGTPGFCRFPSPDYAFSDQKGFEFLGANMGREVQAFAMQQYKKQRHKQPWMFARTDFREFLNNPEENTKPREVHAVARIVDHFDDDKEFGRLFLESLYCTQICRYRKDDSRSDLSWVAMLANEAGLESNEQLFFVDFSDLVGIPRNEKMGWFQPARVVFCMRNEFLTPMAIALFYEAEREWKTHLPGQTTWSTAKMFAKTAAAQDHQIVQHALYTHLIVEPFAVALEKRVPLDHFVYRLLKPHFRYTVDVNFKARTLLIGKDGLFDQFIGTGGIQDGHIKYMAKCYASWSAEKMNFSNDLIARGFDQDPLSDAFELPDYAYAKDAARLWNALELYVRECAMIEYPTENAFAEDYALRNFFLTAQAMGFPSVPTFVPQTRADFIQVACGIIFTASVKHSAVNFPQFAHYSYVVNAPLLLIQPCPAPNAPNAPDLNEYLPRKAEALKAIATVWGLSRFTRGDERFLLSDHAFFNLSFWHDPRFRAVCDQVQSELIAIQEDIETRPATDKYGTIYQWLLPSEIPTSIAT